MEAQKFSFRALLSNKQTNAQITTAAVNNTIMSARKVEDIMRESGFSRSRSRSPHDLGARVTPSPLRIIERQIWNGGMMRQSNSFSNVKK